MSRPDPRQLGLSLTTPPAMGRADFLPAAPNALAMAALDAPGNLPGGRLLLTGPAGSGKTHLASIWTVEREAAWLEPARLADNLAALLAPGAPGRVAVDDADKVAGGPGEEALFHLLNHLAGGRGEVLLTARAPVRDWGLRLPDLASRLSASAHVALEAPDDALLAALLVKLFADRQADVGPELIDWLVRRIDRSFAAARDTVARLDAEALRLRKPLTLGFARSVLARERDAD